MRTTDFEWLMSLLAPELRQQVYDALGESIGWGVGWEKRRPRRKRNTKRGVLSDDSQKTEQ